jgi:hypothetical protein
MTISIVIDCSVVICKQLCFLVSLHYKHFHVLILCRLEASVQDVHDFLKSERKPPAHFENLDKTSKKKCLHTLSQYSRNLTFHQHLKHPIAFVTHFIFVRFFYQMKRIFTIPRSWSRFYLRIIPSSSRIKGSNRIYQPATRFTSIPSLWSTCVERYPEYQSMWKAMVIACSTQFRSQFKVMKHCHASWESAPA